MLTRLPCELPGVDEPTRLPATSTAWQLRGSCCSCFAVQQVLLLLLLPPRGCTSHNQVLINEAVRLLRLPSLLLRGPQQVPNQPTCSCMTRRL